MLRIYHTLWTAPMTREKVHTTQLCFANSFLFAKQLGAQVVLHTDQLGAMMLGDIPYDEIYVYLDELSKGIAPFWAFGKIYATARENIGSVHIDGDVFLQEQHLADLFDGQYDLLVQNEEGEEWRLDKTYKYSQQAITQKNMSNACHIYYPLAYNCGVTQFIDPKLKKVYIDTYFDTVGKVLHDSSFQSRVNLIMSNKDRFGNVVPDIVVEQQCLHEIATRMKSRVKVILTGDINKCADEIGYCHLLSSHKYNMQGELSDTLKKFNRDLYNKITNNPVWKANS